MRVLVVEDERELAEIVGDGLRRVGIGVDVVFDGRSALDKAGWNEYDVIVLDRDLPLVHGDDVCRELHRRMSGTRVLMLTAAGSPRERIEGLQLGADDYLAKPFVFGELVARVRALARRRPVSGNPVLCHDDLVVDTARMHVRRRGAPISLSPKEFNVLVELLNVDGGILSAQRLVERVWDDELDPLSTSPRMTVMRLRRKLGEPALIETVPGLGYRLR